MQENRKQARTVQEEASRERKFWRQNQLWSALLAVVVLFGMMGRTGLSVAPGAAELLLTMADGSTETVEYSSIVSAELLENADYGTAAEGKQTRMGKSGTWEHPVWGSYTLCAYAACSSAVRITTEDRCYVVNLPSEEETDQLYQLIQDKLFASR